MVVEEHDQQFQLGCLLLVYFRNKTNTKVSDTRYNVALVSYVCH